MEVRFERGIIVSDAQAQLYLDPLQRRQPTVISHAHADHAYSHGLMTPATRDVLAVRAGPPAAATADLGQSIRWGDFDVTLHNAGHVLGSAMVQVGDLVYTGDLNPEGGLTVTPADPVGCSTLIIEATFGHPKHRFPPKAEVIRDMQLWATMVTQERPVVVGGYTFGKGQEMIALLNEVDIPVVVDPSIAAVAQVYRDHGVPLRYDVVSSVEEIPTHPHAAVLPRQALSPKRKKKRTAAGTDTPTIGQQLAAHYRRIGAAFGYSSGWCNSWDLARSWGLEAQFPMSDHADFDSLLSFIEACGPEQVLTVFGEARALAQAVTDELGIDAAPLRKDLGRSGKDAKRR